METLTGIPFNILGELFLVNNKKHIKDNLIKDHLTPRGLAHWYMDDGSRCYYKGKRSNRDMSVVLNTQGFEIEEVNKLINELNNKFSLNSYLSFNKKKPIIYIPNKDYKTLYELINPFILPSMKYKLPLKV